MPDLTYRQMDVLKSLYDFPGAATATEIGMMCGYTNDSAAFHLTVGRLKSLKRMGFVRSHITQLSGVIYRLTQAGLAVVEEKSDV